MLSKEDNEFAFRAGNAHERNYSGDSGCCPISCRMRIATRSSRRASGYRIGPGNSSQGIEPLPRKTYAWMRQTA